MNFNFNLIEEEKEHNVDTIEEADMEDEDVDEAED